MEPRRPEYKRIITPIKLNTLGQSIMKKIIKRDGDVFTERVQLSKTEKMLLAAYVYVRFRFLGL